jgi:uncharacterized protein YecT (DUF1311 family)
MIAKTAAVIGLALVLSTEASGATPESELSQEYSTCLDKANGVTFEMTDCIAAETSRQDARLNDNYKKLMSKLSPERKKSLVDAERAWISFRDANCQFYGDPQGGTSARLSANECILNATAQRAKELKLLVDE